MIRRGYRVDTTPSALLRYRPGDWDSPQEWREERARWLREHPPATLADLNAWYGPGTARPARRDPRVCDA